MIAVPDHTPIEVTQFELPADYAKRWDQGSGMFWMQKCETEKGLERWNGAVKRGGEWLYAQIDVEPIAKYAFVCGHDRIRAAKTFIATYGGIAFIRGELVDLKKIPDPAVAPAPEEKPSEGFAIVCGSDRVSAKVVELPAPPPVQALQVEAHPEPVKETQVALAAGGAESKIAEISQQDKVGPTNAPTPKPIEPPAEARPGSKPCIICHKPSYPDGSRLGGLLLYWCENCKTEWA